MVLPLLASLALTLTVDDLKPGETVRYPLLLLHGATEGKAVLVGLGWKSVVRFPAGDGKYAAAVELKPGPNMVIVTSGRETVKVAVTYKPMTTPYRVRAVYLLAADEAADAPRYREKLDLALKMIQSVAAESMREAGYGRKTFALETGPDGKVVVHLIRSESTGEELRSLDGLALYNRMTPFVEKAFPFDLNKNLGVMAFSRWDPRAKKGLAHTALGGGGFGLFGGSPMWSWPSSVEAIPTVFADARPVDTSVDMDDSGLRGTRWATTATTLGAMLHEMGHTFGLPHSADPRSLMSRGFDQFNRRFAAYEPPTLNGFGDRAVTPAEASHWDPFEAARLSLHPWFQPDGDKGARFPAALPPRVTFEDGDVVVSAPYGLGLVGAVREGKPGVFREFKGEKTARLKRSELGEGEASLIAVDRMGNQADVALP